MYYRPNLWTLVFYSQKYLVKFQWLPMWLPMGKTNTRMGQEKCAIFDK